MSPGGDTGRRHTRPGVPLVQFQSKKAQSPPISFQPAGRSCRGSIVALARGGFLPIVFAFLFAITIPTLDPPQQKIEALVDSLHARALSSLPPYAQLTRESVRVFYHLEAPGGYWGAWVVIKYVDNGARNQAFAAGSIDPQTGKINIDPFQRR